MLEDGVVVAIRGAVLDVSFDVSGLPGLEEALLIEDAQRGTVTAEVQAHLDETTIRAIALQATAGVKRGDRVRRTGGPITVPVGDAVLGRLIDVTGRIGDRGGDLPADVPRRPMFHESCSTGAGCSSQNRKPTCLWFSPTHGGRDVS